MSLKPCAGCDLPLVPANLWKRGVQPQGCRRHQSRGLCSRCYSRAKRRDQVLDHPRETMSRDDLLDDYYLIARNEPQITIQQMAERLRMKRPTLQRAITRARARGDKRAVYLARKQREYVRAA